MLRVKPMKEINVKELASKMSLNGIYNKENKDTDVLYRTKTVKGDKKK